MNATCTLSSVLRMRMICIINSAKHIIARAAGPHVRARAVHCLFLAADTHSYDVYMLSTAHVFRSLLHFRSLG